MQIGSIHTVAAIATFLGLETKGDVNQIVTGINVPECAVEGDLTLWLSKDLKNSACKASFFLTDQSVELLPHQAIIHSTDPVSDFNRLTQKFVPIRRQKSMEGENCVIADTAHLSPNCFIGNDVVIGENVVIHPGAYIGDGTVIDEGAIIGPNAVIGQVAFAIQRNAGSFQRLHTCGFVSISKNVEVGASTVIEAGLTSITQIGEGTKLSNLVHIGHDAQLGSNCVIHALHSIAPFQHVPDFAIL
jgi:UDP-3-O-[3-hydroxymyristoyl] glucosamine N-acyltransferase